jgi:hypothetical protein
MASESSSHEPIELVIPADDLILPFQADQADVVGRLVKLGPVVDTILSRHDYPEPVSKLLGEAVALTALLGAALKFEGKFILQTKTDGPVDMIVADYQAAGGIRGYARFDRDKLKSLGPTPSQPALMGNGYLAMTVDQGLDKERYQGIVPLDGADSDALLAMPQLRDLRGKRVVIFRGEGGRQLLADELRERGAEVNYIECYRRVRPETDPSSLIARWEQGGLHAVTAMSGETLDNLWALIGESGQRLLRSTPLFVSHASIAERAAHLGLTEVAITPPGDEGILRGLSAWFSLKVR